MKALLNPDSVAIVGASKDANKMGGRLLNFTVKHGYKGKLYPINPGETEILGLRCYPNISEVPGEVDLACLIVGAAASVDVLRQLPKGKVKTAIVFASGFSEAGETQLQHELTRVAGERGIRVCGPNSIGIINAVNHTCVSFTPALEIDHILPGDLAFVTQSGALGGALLTQAWERGIGFSYWVSSGNEADLDSSDWIAYLATDPNVKVITLFMEGVKDGGKFKEACRRAFRAGKPVVVFKTGKSPVGKQAVQSHSGSLAGVDEVYNAVFSQLGVIRVAEVTSLFDVALALAWLPLPRGNRVAVVSTSGGACSILADACMETGLEINELSSNTRLRLNDIIPAFGSTRNPVDLTAQLMGNPNKYREVFEILLADSNIDGLIILLGTVVGTLAEFLSKEIVALAKEAKKPVCVAWLSSVSMSGHGMSYLMESKIPVYTTPENAVLATKALVDYSRYISNHRVC